MLAWGRHVGERERLQSRASEERRGRRGRGEIWEEGKSERTEINQRDELRIVAAPVVEEQGEDSPCQGQHGDDEQNQDVVGSQDIVVDIAIDKVGQHAHRGDEGEDLGESPEDETDCEDHLEPSGAVFSQ